MFVRIGKVLLVFALVVTLGAHWALLQTVAWTTMLANNLQSGSFHEAVTKTFDGKHPCCLCKAIAAAKKSEKKNDFSFQPTKLEFLMPREKIILFAPSLYPLLSREYSFAKSLAQKPLLQPPRGFFI